MVQYSCLSASRCVHIPLVERAEGQVQGNSGPIKEGACNADRERVASEVRDNSGECGSQEGFSFPSGSGPRWSFLATWIYSAFLRNVLWEDPSHKKHVAFLIASLFRPKTSPFFSVSPKQCWGNAS